MRDVTFKSITSQDHKKRQLIFKEETEENGVSAMVKKDYGYSVKSVMPLSQIGSLKYKSGLKDLSVCRNHNSKTGEDRFEYRLIADLFVVNHDKLFIVEFTYYFSIDSSVLSLQKKGH